MEAAQYYERKSYLLNIPLILVTALTGILSFVSTSDMVGARDKNIFSLTVGILGFIATIMQSFQNTFKFNTKSEMFRNSADQYDMLITTIDFENINPNDKEFINNLEKKILEIQNSCKYFPLNYDL